MSKFVGVEPLGSLNVIKFRHVFTGVNACLCVARRQALLLILGQPVEILPHFSAVHRENSVITLF